MLQHLKFSLPDWVICTLASLGLGINVVQSFYLPEALSRDWLRIAVISALVIAVLVVCSYSKVTAIISGVVVVIGIIQVFAMSAFGIVKGFVESEDPEANSGLWYFVIVVCAVLVYLLSRTRVTSWLLLIVGMITAAYFQVLEYTVYIWGALLFMLCMGAWLCFIGYRRNMMKISALRSAFAPMAGWSVGVSLICLLLGCLLWVGVIRPIQPPTKDIYLLTDYLQVDRLQQLGLISDDELYDSSLYSSWLNENLSELTNQADWVQEQEDQMEVQGTQQDAQGTQQQEHSEDLETSDRPPSNPVAGVVHWITYNKSNVLPLIVLVILLVLILAGLVVLFLKRRKIWYRYKTKDMGDDEYIRFFYGWYLTRLKRLKLSQPKGDTPLEYARRMEVQTRFLDATGITWQEITEIFARLAYSGHPASPEDRKKFEQFYAGFFRCCRKKLHFAWIWYTLRI